MELSIEQELKLAETNNRDTYDKRGLWKLCMGSNEKMERK